MHDYIIKRLFLFAPTIILATMIVFALMWIVPGDAAMMILAGTDADNASVSLDELEKLRERLGLNRPIYVQYGDWLWDMVRGDLGTSLWYKVPVMDYLGPRFLVTMQLGIMGMGMALILAVPMGMLSAVKQDSWLDHAARLFTTAGIAIPSFWLGILILYLLTYAFNWLPPLGYAKIWQDPLENLQQLFFPALAIAFHDLAFTARVTRSSMLEVLREDYVRTARAKGLKERVVIGRHALKNCLLPVITVWGYQFGRVLGGVVIIESIFVVPGMGSFLVESIRSRDFVVIQGVIVLVAAVVLFLNLIIDMFYAWIDPRVRYQ